MTTIDIDETQLRSRAAVYRLLGQLWLKEIDIQQLRELRSSPLQKAFAAAGGTLPDGNSNDAETLDELAIDYCQLFLGPKEHLPPYQSVWSDGHFQGQATTATQLKFTAMKLPQPSGMVDHLGEQLTAMALIIERIAACDVATPTDLDAAQLFFVEHLSWPGELCKLAAQRAQTTFYRSLVSMTHAFLSEEQLAWSMN